MGVPYKLKTMTVRHNGDDYFGEVSEVTIPTVARKFEGYRGSFDSELPIDMGGEPITFEWKMGGIKPAIYRGFGISAMDGEMLRFIGFYQEDGNGSAKTVEITVRGRHQEIAPGTGKAGEDTEESIKTACVYYKLTVDGSDLIEIDVLNHVFIVGGVDRLAAQRAALGI